MTDHQYSREYLLIITLNLDLKELSTSNLLLKRIQLP